MKILQINATYRIGSTGEIIAGIAQVSAAAGFDTYYVCASLSEDQRNDHIFVMGNRLDHKIHALRSRILGKQGSGSLLATLNLLKWMMRSALILSTCIIYTAIISMSPCCFTIFKSGGLKQ